MPIKVCPKCNTKHGVRRLICECGHEFKRKIEVVEVTPEESIKTAYPEPGQWIWDMPKGMSPVCPPAALPTGQLSVGTVRARVSYDGLGFCIYSLIPAARIADSQLRELWMKARATMKEIVTLLGQATWEDDEEPVELKQESDEVDQVDECEEQSDE